MATIVSTSVSIYAGITDSGTQVGNTITVQGSPANVTINSSTLGVALQPGHQYCAVASCVNSDNYPASTQPYAFKTLILAEIVTITGGNASLYPEMSFTYDNNVISVSECGVYLSTNSSGSSAVKYTATNGQQEAEQGWTITGLTENTTYYAIPYVIDDLGREYRGDWADADTVSSGYANPTVTISNVATTYNSVSGNLSVSTNDTLSSVYIEFGPTGGGPVYKINKNTTTGTQTFTITDGDYDDSAVPQEIHINQSTEYRIRVYATNSHGGTGDAQATVTTQQQATSTIAITSITGITPTSAVVNLAFGSAQNQQPGS